MRSVVSCLRVAILLCCTAQLSYFTAICTKTRRFDTLGMKVHHVSSDWHAMIATELPSGLGQKEPVVLQSRDAERQSLWRLGKRGDWEL